MRRTPQQKSTKAKSFGANIFMHCILLLWESQKRRSEPNILTRCCAAFRRAPFPQSLPRFYPSDRRCRVNRKEHSHLTVPFLRRGFSPRFSVSAQMRRPCSVCDIHILYIIMSHFARFVNTFTQKKDDKNRPFLLRHRPIFPGGCPPSIFGTNELNYCVRNGNRWILVVISTA